MQDYTENMTMVELFILETNQLVEQLEAIIIQCEKESNIGSEDINSIFRIMHTIKGSSAMMAFNNISELSHSIEDLFFYIREHKDLYFDFNKIYKIVLEFIDYIKDEIIKLEKGGQPDTDCQALMDKSKALLKQIKNTEADSFNKIENEALKSKSTEKSNSQENYYCIKVVFESGSEMENVRGHLLLYSLKVITQEIIKTIPQNLDIEESASEIKIEGFFICLSSFASQEEIEKIISSTLSVDSFKIINAKQPPNDLKSIFDSKSKLKNNSNIDNKLNLQRQQNYISVHSDKLNILMDLVGELVISEAMVTNNPDLYGLKLDNFNKSAHQLRKLINELRDVVVDIRMLPISVVFHKMNRIIRDMSIKMKKEIEFVVSGEDTHVDKSVIDILSEPIMHLIRNAVDHGIEGAEERKKANKPFAGRISLKAWQNNNYAIIQISDDGRGIDKKEIYKKAKERGLITKSYEELMDKEIFAFILSAGFSTKKDVTEFSGRGVGMDVVKKNIDLVSGSISIESEIGKGTTITLRIPLTLLIVNTMNLKIGNMSMAVPLRNVLEIKRVKKEEIVSDQDGNEMTVIRGVCYPVIRLSRLFDIDTEVTSIEDGVLLIVEGDYATACIFADKIEGERQVVVKPLPKYIKNANGILGCSIQNDGRLSLILDINEILNRDGSA